MLLQCAFFTLTSLGLNVGLNNLPTISAPNGFQLSPSRSFQLSPTLPAAFDLATFLQIPKSFVDAAVFSAAQNASIIFGANSNPFLKFSTLNPSSFSPGSLSGIFSAAFPENIKAAQEASTIEGLSKQLSLKLGLSNSATAFVLSDVAFQPEICSVPLEKPVISLKNPFINLNTLPSCVLQKYRSFNGSCNNPAFPNRGKDSTLFIRLLRPIYADGISEPRKNNRGQDLPSARLISTTVVDHKINLADWTHLFMQFGQFLDHDLTSTPQTQLSSEQPQCCGTNNTHPACFPIQIPPSDIFYSQTQETCMEFVRSLPGTRPGCQLGSREQLNQVNSFLDGSQIYGITADQATKIRAFKNGLLKTGQVIGSSRYIILPPDPQQTCSDGTPSQPCFFAGDTRVNEQIALQALHTVFMRYHNMLASQLFRLNPMWEDEKIFQETRRIVGAALQHITYNEWLPVLLGPAEQTRQQLDLVQNGFLYNGYDITINPSIANEFATAAFRVGHVMTTGTFNRMRGDGSISSTDKLQDTFLKSGRLYVENAVDEIIAGLSRDLGKQVENSMTDDLQQHCYGAGNSAVGLDLVSLNIQRGRDHGLPGYMKYRQWCRLPTAGNFSEMSLLGDLSDDVISKLSSLYEHVEDIDLYIGGISEKRINGGIIGPTFACIISEQFRRTRAGDRFWYENNLPLKSTLTTSQLEEVRKITMARILCDTNLVMNDIQPRVFQGITANNSLTSCLNIPTMNLTPWAGV